MKKSSLSLFAALAVTLLCLCSANKAMAQVVASGTTGACTWQLTGTSPNYTLTISGAGAMGNYNDYYYVPWYSYHSSIKTLVIQQGVTTIGNHAFYECRGLTSVTIPNSVTTIGEFAFDDCEKLTSITIPNSVTAIGNNAFRYCSGLTSVTIGNSVTVIGNWAFGSCSGLTSLTIPNSVTGIGESAFSSCSGLTSVTLGNSVVTIRDYAFASCRDLTEIYVKAVNPPVLGKNVFDVSTTIPVYVCGSVDAYRAATGWGDYFLNILPYNNCGVSIKENKSLKDLSLYPNPATESVTVLLPENAGRALFTLYDMQGKALLRQEVSNGNAVEVSHLADGIYLYQVAAGAWSYQGKVVKQ